MVGLDNAGKTSTVADLTGGLWKLNFNVRFSRAVQSAIGEDYGTSHHGIRNS